MRVNIIKKCLAGLAVCISMIISTATFAMPSGNYQRTCHGCFMNGSTLVCHGCKDRQNINRGRTKLKHAHNCRFVENRNGRLSCTGGRYNKHHNKWINAGPIMNNKDAKNRCPHVCHRANRTWNGQWRTIKNGRTSVCQCRK